jgi:hypothetical protein
MNAERDLQSIVFCISTWHLLSLWTAIPWLNISNTNLSLIPQYSNWNSEDSFQTYLDRKNFFALVAKASAVQK